MAKKRVEAGRGKTAKPPVEGRAEHAPARTRANHANAALPDPFSLTDGFVERALPTGERRDLLGGAVLAGAEMEGRCLPATLAGLPHVRTTGLFGRQATWDLGRAAFRLGDFDIVRYGGHAFFEPAHRGHSGIVSHGEVLSESDLADPERLPELVFFNACENARGPPPRAQDRLGRQGQLLPLLRKPPLRVEGGQSRVKIAGSGVSAAHR